jgi:tRNA (guanine10-N2)-methyltransferase
MDPFVGTGSLLVACAALGASLCIGTDIDVRVLKGMNRIARATDANIFTNFKQYQLPPPCILRADNSERGNVFAHLHHHGSASKEEQCRVPFLDAIVCDPPYGVRAGAKKCGTTKLMKHKKRMEDYKDGHVTMTQKYETEDVMLDLLNMAASMLVVGGRLVYLLPCLVSFNSDDELPIHPCLKLIANSEQPLSQYWSRRLITMEKCMPYDPKQAHAYLQVAREQIHKGQSKHQQASVAYTDLQNKIKQMSKDNKSTRSVGVKNEGGGSNSSNNSNSSNSSNSSSNSSNSSNSISISKRSSNSSSSSSKQASSLTRIARASCTD